jgi:hypothetical protein
MFNACRCPRLCNTHTQRACACAAQRACLVVLLRQRLGALEQLQPLQHEALALEARDDVAHDAALHAVWLDLRAARVRSTTRSMQPQPVTRDVSRQTARE